MNDSSCSIFLSTVPWGAADWKFDNRVPIIHHLAVRFGSRLYRTVSTGISLVPVVRIINKTTGEAFMPLDLFLPDIKSLSSGCIRGTWDQRC